MFHEGNCLPLVPEWFLKHNKEQLVNKKKGDLSGKMILVYKLNCVTVS